jgi:hypothetical protein
MVFLMDYNPFSLEGKRMGGALFRHKCGYLEAEVARPLYELYDRILGKLVVMIRQPEKWVIGATQTR